MKTHIKFRVWDINNKEFVNDMCIHTDGTLMCDCGKTGYFQKFVVQQFTGRIDDDNKEIYEGDIVLLSNGEKVVSDMIDFYVIPADQARVKIEKAENGEFFGSNSEFSFFTLLEYESWKVIGNVCQNPELIQ